MFAKLFTDKPVVGMGVFDYGDNSDLRCSVDFGNEVVAGLVFDFKPV